MNYGSFLNTLIKDVDEQLDLVYPGSCVKTTDFFHAHYTRDFFDQLGSQVELTAHGKTATWTENSTKMETLLNSLVEKLIEKHPSIVRIGVRNAVMFDAVNESGEMVARRRDVRVISVKFVCADEDIDSAEPAAPAADMEEE